MYVISSPHEISLQSFERENTTTGRVFYILPEKHMPINDSIGVQGLHRSAYVCQKILGVALSCSASLFQSMSKMEDNKQHSYFTGMPESLAKSCDTLLLLDDGTKLPAHAAILARSSELFSDMLDGGPLAAASQSNMVVVPISECKEDVANSLLAIIYTSNYRKYITESSALTLATLGHKLNVKVTYGP